MSTKRSLPANAITDSLVDWCLDSLLAPADHDADPDIDLSILTVVVPSFNRQAYLLRQIRFWVRSSARLVIVDGSSAPLDSRVLSAVGVQPRIEYLHLPRSFADRTSAAAELVQTPYAVLLGDDEFHLPTGLRACLDVLEQDQNLVGCLGECLGFSLTRRQRQPTFSGIYPSLRGFRIAHKEPADRLVAAMSWYAPATCYAVLRTPAWRSSWGKIDHWSSPTANEMQHALVAYLLGRVVSTNHLQWLRSSENPPVASLSLDSVLSIPEWWESPQYADERSEFVECVVSTVLGDLDADADEISTWVTRAIDVKVGVSKAALVDSTPRFGRITRLASLARRAVSLFLRVLRHAVYLFPDRLYLGLKRLIGNVGRTFARPAGKYYGTTSQLTQILESQGVNMAPTTVQELVDLDVLVREFHAIRSQGTCT